ncbi:UTRA domain-containing protein, partial [Shigella dysenteriae]|uniref:UTRA domain-containing protein n=3 Tax=Shigella dysenteriae TaxID=622 RepID=UPI000E5C9AA5
HCRLNNTSPSIRFLLHAYEQTGIALRRSQTRISARRAQAKECQRLEIPNMSPLLCVRTLNHRDGESSPAEYSVSLTRADMIEFTMEH